jgi:hypothetical protein
MPPAHRGRYPDTAATRRFMHVSALDGASPTPGILPPHCGGDESSGLSHTRVAGATKSSGISSYCPAEAWDSLAEDLGPDEALRGKVRRAESLGRDVRR